MTDPDRFEQDVLPHLDAAYALARWLTRDQHSAEDVVQEALLRAMRSIAGFRGVNGRGWVLAIVRNTAYTWLQRNRPEELLPMNDDLHDPGSADPGPDAAMISAERRELMQQALARLPLPYREALVLREVEGMSYKAIAELAQVPIGTVMSRLARAREQLARLLGPGSTSAQAAGEVPG